MEKTQRALDGGVTGAMDRPRLTRRELQEIQSRNEPARSRRAELAVPKPVVVAKPPRKVDRRSALRRFYDEYEVEITTLAAYLGSILGMYFSYRSRHPR